MNTKWVKYLNSTTKTTQLHEIKTTKLRETTKRKRKRNISKQEMIFIRPQKQKQQNMSKCNYTKLKPFCAEKKMVNKANRQLMYK